MAALTSAALIPLIAAGVGAAGSIAGGAIGAAASAGDRQRAQEAAQRAQKELESLGIPSEQALQYVMTNPEFVSQFTPKEETAVQQQESAFQEIEGDPRLKEAQLKALQTLEQEGNTPLNDIERASLNEQRRNVAAEEQARQGQILQQMAARGMGGAGAELAARLSSSQASANRSSEETDRLKAMAQQRALDAIARSGALGGQIRSQDFSEAASEASAIDVINQFNAAQRAGVQQRNVSSSNQAAQREADIRQQLEQLRATNANEAAKRAADVAQLNFNNQLQLAQIKSGAAKDESRMFQDRASNTAQTASSIGSGIGSLAGTVIKGAAGAGSGKVSVMPEAKIVDENTRAEEEALKKKLLGK